MSKRGLMGTCLAVTVGVTLVVVLAPAVPFAARNPAMHAAIETAAGIIALLAALLTLMRYRRKGALPDLLLTLSFVAFGSANLVYSAAPAASTAALGNVIDTWAALGTRLLSALLFAGAALAPDRPVSQRTARIAFALEAGALVSIGLVVLATAEHLPRGAGLTMAQQQPGMWAHPAVVGFQGVLFFIFSLAAVAFWRKSEDDELAHWLAAASVLAAAARLHYLLYPSLYAGVVYSGDILRIGFYALLLVASARELERYSRSAAQAEALERRREIAHALHDGLAQELAVVAGHARSLARREPDEQTQLIASSAQRALDESRRAIAALGRAAEDSVATALSEAVEEAARRLGGAVRLDVAHGLPVTPAEREMLIRIAREAATNALLHAEAEEITVRLSNSDGMTLTIRDDGRGFDAAAVRATGLAMMREQAARLDWDLSIDSRPGEGTTVEVGRP